MYLLYIYIYIIHIDSYYRVPLPKPTCLQFLVIFTVLGGLLCNVGRNLRRWQRKRCASSFETQHSLSSLDLHSTCACLVSGGTQTLIAAALVIFPWICCQTETKMPLWKVQGRCSANRPTVWQTWMKEQTMIEKAVAKCLNMTKVWTLWRMWMASFKMFCCVVHVAKPCSMLWDSSPSSSEADGPSVGSCWFFTCTSYIGTAAPRRWHGQKVTCTRYLGFCQQVSNRKRICQQMKRQLLFMKVAVRLAV